MQIKRLTIQTIDLAGTEHFYREVLGLQTVDNNSAEITFAAGYTNLTFQQSNKSNPLYHFAFSIPSNKVDEAHSYIAGKTPILPFFKETTIADFSNWNAHAFYFHDNQKNIVEFIAHHDLQNDSDKPFSASSIIGVCEIGIPVKDVTEACKDFNEKYGAPYFTKGPRLQDFSVMGDEQGLFIVTKIGRGWLPTQQPAERYRTTVVFESDGKEKVYQVN
jgi:catechol-2,3-dioxygenase